MEPANYPREVTFAFPNATCSTLFNDTTKVAFITNLKHQLANAASINVNTVNEFSITCGSLMVKYQQTHATGQTAAAAAQAMQNLVTGNSLTITIGGQTLTVNPSSFSSKILIPPYGVTPVPPANDDDGLSNGAIIGIIFGVVIFLIIIIGCVYCKLIRPNNRKRVTINPSDGSLELPQGR